jgi:exopolysaccharide biosynthesis predicted pyruvyltransferase EpsI
MMLLSQQDLSGMERFLSQFAGREVLYHPNPGNAGDALIALGTYSVFERHNIRFKIIELDANVDEQVVFLSGGGNLVPLYHSIENALNRFHKKASQIILLPHTIRGNESLLAKLGKNCTIFCRDAVSYEHVTSNNSSSDVYLDHDMAFHIDAPSFLADANNSEAYSAVVTQKLGERGLLNIRDRPLLNFSRLDDESTRRVKASDMDLSIDFSLGVKGGWPEFARKASWCLLKTVSMAKRVQTDRLHIGISCALVGTPCSLYDNSYGKNASIYRHSLRTRAPHLEFCGVSPEDIG